MQSSTSAKESPQPTTSTKTTYFDVLIVGAGLSGIGAAHYIQKECADKSYAILEMRPQMGGTWDLFKYPGIRSDSDMYTLGYAFRPWKEAKAIADGPSILKYINDTAKDEGIDKNIHYNRKVIHAAWSSENTEWTVEVENRETQEVLYYKCNFLFMCSGYYNYEEGYTPDFKGTEDFKGTIVHPQKWPENLDYTDKKVVVIGSGATAVTLVPEMAKKASLVTMLQRSPTYIASLPAIDGFANFMRKILPQKMAYSFNRWRKVLMGLGFYKLARSKPNFTKKLIVKGVKKALGKDYDVETHFSPNYNPWDQRLCMVPDNDLFDAINEGKADVVTDHIETFTEKGLALKSGKELEADIIVTATGLKILFLGGMTLTVDGKKINPSEHYVYRGMMISDVPNLALSIGYTNASWTLKTDLTCEYVCRLLNHMNKTGTKYCTPKVDPSNMEDEPLLDFNSGYVLRALDGLPKQGSKKPWKLNQNYPMDVMTLRYSSLKDDALEYK